MPRVYHISTAPTTSAMHGASQRGLWKWQAVDSLGTAPKPAAPNLTTSFGKLAQPKVRYSTCDISNEF